MIPTVDGKEARVALLVLVLAALGIHTAANFMARQDGAKEHE